MDTKTNFHWRKVRMQVETTEGLNCYTSFYGLDCTRERIQNLLKKGQTTINVWADVKTSDDYILRVFLTSYTVRNRNQKKSNCYAKASQLRIIRKKVRQHLVKYATKKTVNQLAKDILNESVSKNIVTVINKIFPVKIVLVTKVKVLKKPSVDTNALLKDSKQNVVKDRATGANKLIADVEQEVEQTEQENAEANAEATVETTETPVEAQ